MASRLHILPQIIGTHPLIPVSRSFENKCTGINIVDKYRTNRTVGAIGSMTGCTGKHERIITINRHIDGKGHIGRFCIQIDYKSPAGISGMSLTECPFRHGIFRFEHFAPVCLYHRIGTIGLESPAIHRIYRIEPGRLPAQIVRKRNLLILSLPATQKIAQPRLYGTINHLSLLNEHRLYRRPVLTRSRLNKIHFLSGRHCCHHNVNRVISLSRCRKQIRQALFLPVHEKTFHGISLSGDIQVQHGIPVTEILQ